MNGQKKKIKNVSKTCNTRNTSFDLLRICAAVMVVMLHVSASKWQSIAPVTAEWMSMNFYDCLTRSAVPLFFMLSGAFMLQKDIPLKELYLKKIIPLTIIYFMWSFLYAIKKIGLERIITVGVAEIISVTVKSHYHLWFIPTLIGVYMLQPVLCTIVDYKNGIYVKYFIILFCVFGVVRPTVLMFLTNDTVKALITKVPVELMSYSGYVIMGYFFSNMNKRRYKPWVMIMGFITVVVVATFICQIDALNKGIPSDILYGYFSLTTFLEALFLFLCFKNIRLNYSTKMQKVLYNISSLTFGVYLFHPFVLQEMDNRFHLTTLSYNTFLAIPVNTIVIVLICFCVTAVMIKIPIVNKLWKY